MRELPGGTVTFLFTDIEGSTRLLHELGKGYADALTEHRRILRGIFERYRGVEVDTQGDAFFVAFARAQDALAAAAAAQQALAEGPLRVRIGMHTGEPLVTAEGYVGLDVHRAARIAAAGHGGQTLISQTTRDLLASARELELRDLGLHRLKDLTTPERLYQLGHDEWPPLKSLNQTNLPVQPTSLVGRKRELMEVLELIHKQRIVTLTGPGGSGKTRLALQAAAEVVDEYADGVWFVSLSSLRDPNALLPTIAQVIGAAPSPTVGQQLEQKQLLLVLDNFEQLLDGAAQVAELLRSASSLNVLVTSRAPLHLAGEREYAVPPLADADAVTLFVERVRATDPTFQPDEHVASICRRVDNLPLAIELAAARTKVLLPAQLFERLEQSLPLLSDGARDAPERQRTLRATIDWSYELLDDPEKELFRALPVFSGSFELDSAEEVSVADVTTLSSLVDKSLLRRTAAGRFFLLATIREYALELAVDDSRWPSLRQRHAERVLRVAEAAKAKHHDGLNVLEADHDDARAAFEFLVDTEPEQALRLAIAYGDFWYVRGHAREGDRRLDLAISATVDAPVALRIPALIRAASLARIVGDAERAERRASAALELARRHHDDSRAAEALRELGDAMAARDDYGRAFSLYQEALDIGRELGESTVPTLTNLADVALAAGTFEQAITYSAEALARASEPDADSVRAIARFNTASALIQLGRSSEARPFLRDALEAVVTLDYPELIGWCLIGVSALAAELQSADAVRLLAAADASLRSSGASLGPAERRLRKWTVELIRDPVALGVVEEHPQKDAPVPLEEALSLARAYLTLPR